MRQKESPQISKKIHMRAHYSNEYVTIIVFTRSHEHLFILYQ